LKAKFSSSITIGERKGAFQEIANKENAGNSVKRDSVKRDIKEIQ
jgi:hypothetical protein